MQTTYSFIIFTLFFFSLNAQVYKKNTIGSFRVKKGYQKYIKSDDFMLNQKSLDVFYTNTFDDSTEWITTNSSVPNLGNWVVGPSGPTGYHSSYFGTIVSTSGGNFALFDSDVLGSSNAIQNAVLELSTPINCVGKSNVALLFESYYTRWATSKPSVEVSPDGGNTWVIADSSFHENLGLSESTNNPELVTVFLSPIADNQSDVRIRFRYQGSWDYAWMIDDIKVGVLQGLDAQITGVRQFPQPELAITPISQLQEIYSLKAVIQNNLIEVLNNPVCSVNINNGLFMDYYTTPVTMSYSDTAHVSFNFSSTNIIAPEMLNIAFSLDASNSGNDEDLLNNHDTIQWSITDSVMGSFWGGYWNALPYSHVHTTYAFEVINADTVTSASAFIYFESGTEGQQTRVHILDSLSNIIATSNPVNINTQDTGVYNQTTNPGGMPEKIFNFPDGGIMLTPGKYFLLHEDKVDGVASVMFDQLTTTENTSFVSTDSIINQFSNFSLNGTWAMYINFGKSNLLTNSNTFNKKINNFFLYPNPSRGILNIVGVFNESDDKKIEILDLSGKVLYLNHFTSKELKEEFSISHLSEGIYLMRISSKNSNIVKQFSVK